MHLGKQGSEEQQLKDPEIKEANRDVEAREKSVQNVREP